MKLFLFALIIIFSFSAFAQDEGKFAERKNENIKHIESRISALEKGKSCIQSANDNAALKACRKSMKETNQAMRKEKKGQRRQKMDERIKKMQERRKKMDQE